MPLPVLRKRKQPIGQHIGENEMNQHGLEYINVEENIHVNIGLAVFKLVDLNFGAFMTSFCHFR